jgi:hypothetical protein
LREWLPVFITDWNLAKHYGLTDEELDFIINYDTCQPAGRSSIAWAGARMAEKAVQEGNGKRQQLRKTKEK